MNNPEYVRTKNGKNYKINTDFRVALKCNEVSMDTSIGDLERTLAIVYLLFGDEGIDPKNRDDLSELVDLGYRYLTLDKEPINGDEEPDMDFIKDKKYIRSSFIQDYKYNPYDMEYLHWWDFYNDLNNLSNSEFGNCCVLNRIRNARNYDPSKIEDKKERENFIKFQESISLNKEENKLTKEQEESMNRLNEIIGFK